MEAELFDTNCGSSFNSMLLILDRREDPITPMLNQWTYEAMLHELVTISLNRIDVKKMGMSKSSDKGSELVLSVDTDNFYAANLYSNYGELAANVKVLVDRLQEKTKQHQNIESLEDMQRVLNNFPEYKRESSNVYKHVDLMTALSRIVESRHLLDISKIEQNIAVSENREEHLRVILIT
jgi:vacuolar protein sorting-associated protein 45